MGTQVYAPDTACGECADMSEAGLGNASAVIQYRDSLGKAVAKNLLVLSTGLSINYVNVGLIYTFCKHQIFFSDPRYILFFHLVVNDMIQTTVSIILFMISYILYRMSVFACTVLFLAAVVTNENTPLNLACMAAECYIAVCLPLQHARICTVKRTLALIALIWTCSLMSILPDLLVTLATEPPEYFSSRVFCTRSNLFPNPLLAEKHKYVYIIYLLLVWPVIFFTYFKIFFVAQSASKDAKKAQRTVMLHGFQLLLCMTTYVFPTLQQALFRWFPKNYSDSLFGCFIIIHVLPRAISPILYGVRDKCFRKYLKHYFLCNCGPDSAEIQSKNNGTAPTN
ncbi:odorant receptor 131-2 isoform X1 [Syngnathus scovelli]|uniref:odorant receptor 131-2 isoform X1 n=1 Tax=Syngnathus scovelli TaxID=161590 RepID=UPI00210F9BA5|nr:odorant receptor 131-2 isoform X1 [Syngnathus scovelli]